MNPFAFVSQVSSQSDSSIETTTSRIRLRLKLIELWDFELVKESAESKNSNNPNFAATVFTSSVQQYPILVYQTKGLTGLNLRNGS